MNAVVWGKRRSSCSTPRPALDERIIDQAAELHESGVRVRTRTLFYEEWLGKIPVHELGRVSLFFDIGEVHRDRYGRMKRVFDVVVGIVGSVVLVALLPLVFSATCSANRGPMFFVQERVGRLGRTSRSTSSARCARTPRLADGLDGDVGFSCHTLRRGCSG